ncbi:MAG TPA: insulinase family protein [Caldithrix abyssi]|uniref:Insulinase family protein n=1 Tax=Caldithrix abyssi TaxID=187145 RepID=A0A7V4U5C0_CALAY|nr:insulinase family protein [Caldithrix abyssi]
MAVDRNQVPSPQKPTPFNFPRFERFTLSNGLQVLFAPHHKLPLVNLQMVVKSSALHDPDGKEGLVNLLAEMLLEGTEQRSSRQIADELERLGASYSADADWNAVHIGLNLLKPNLDKGAEVFADIIRRSVFLPEEVERLRRELLVERLRAVDNPKKVAQEQFFHRIYKGYRYALPLEGTEETLKAILREDIIRFYETHFNASNATLIVVGDLTLAEAQGLAQKYFGDWPGGQTVSLSLLKAVEGVSARVTLVNKEGAAQSELCLGHHGVDRHVPEYFALTLLNQIIGGYFLSRLNLKLREERGYTYGIHSNFFFRRLPGPFCVSAALQSEHTAEAIEEIIDEIDRMTKETVEERELEQAKGYLSGMFPIAFETADQIAMGLGNIDLFDLPDDYYRTFRDNLAKVTVNDVLQAAQKYLKPKHLHIVLSGNGKILERQLKERFDVMVVEANGD